MSQLDKFNFLPHLIWFVILFVFFYLIVFFFIAPSFFGSLKTRFLFFLHIIESSCKYSWFCNFLTSFFFKIDFYNLLRFFNFFLKKKILLSYLGCYLRLKFYI